MNEAGSIRAFKCCPFTHSEKRIEAMGKLQPILDAANASQDEDILLAAAEACENANPPLLTLAKMYRTRAGSHVPTETEIKSKLAERALHYIKTKGMATPSELQHFLNLTRHEWYPIANYLKKRNLVDMKHHHYVPKSLLSSS